MNPKILIIVSAATLSHLFNWCVIGACDAVFSGLQANLGSTTYLIGMSLMTANYVKFPAFLERPSKPVLYVYYILLSFFASSLAIRLIWVPLNETIGEMNMLLAKAITLSNKSLRLGRKSQLRKLAAFLETKTALSWVANFIGVTFLYWVCDSLNVQKSIKHIIKRMPWRPFEDESSLPFAALIQRKARLKAAAVVNKSKNNEQKCSFLDVREPELDYTDED